MTMKKLLAIALISIACKDEEVSFSTTEQARLQARDNAVWNLQKTIHEDPRFQGLEVVARGDSTISNKCPQGDGWASITLVDKATKKSAFELKCSTVSVGIGCMTQEDFDKKSYKEDDGHCQPTNKVPFPLPKLGAN